MSETNFTPGPWKLNGHYIEARSGLGIARIAIVDDGAGTLPGNASILAAAPELYEALDGLLDALPSATMHPAIKAARAALAKARGEG